VTEFSLRTPLGLNHQTYERLKASLSLCLRRQIFIAVCDDLQLRDRLAAQLQTDLTAANPPCAQTVPHTVGPLSRRSPAADAELPRLVSLALDLNDPHPIGQIAQWLSQFPMARRGLVTPMPAFQILGIERLTRQPAEIQSLFLLNLQGIEENLPLLESTLLLWVTQPWYRTLPEAAPEFWRCRTGVFEFVGDPTPLPAVSPERIWMPQPSPVTLPPIPIAEEWDEGTANSTDAAPEVVESTAAEASAPAIPDNPWMTLAQAFDQQLDHDQWYEAEPTPSPLPDALPADSIELDLQSALPLAQQIEQLQQHIQLLQQQSPSPMLLASAYRTLGNFYRNCIEQGDSSLSTLTLAIQSYEQCLGWLPDSEPLRIDTLNDLGNLYWMLSRCQSDPNQALPTLQQAIQTYQLALQQLDPQSQTYPMLQNNLGAAYADLARYQDPAQNLQQSVQAYQQALRYRTAASDPIRYASTQNNLGTTYWNLAQHHQPEVNLKQAIAAYSEALRYYDPQQDPLNYAMIQNNLGTAYWNLAQYGQPQDRLKQAVASYQAALQYRTLETAPAAFAATQNNLGTAYWHIANHADNSEERLAYLQQAIAAYKATLQAADYLSELQPNVQPTLTFDLASTHNNLGLAHYQIATDVHVHLTSAAQSAHLEAALRHHTQALQSWDEKPELRQTALACILQTVRAFYNQLGLPGQNLALSSLPTWLLPEILPKL